MINRNYTTLLIAYFTSSIGDWLYRLALPLLIFKLTNSALDMAIAYGITFLPFVLVTPFGGVIADRLNRQKILIYGDLASFVCALILAFVALFDRTEVWIFYPLIFLVSAFNSLVHPSFQSILPMIVENDRLAKANAYVSSTDNIMTLLGPLCGGVIIAFMGSLNAIYLNAFSFLLSALLISTIRISPSKEVTILADTLTLKKVFKDLAGGFRYIWGHNAVIKYGCLLFIFANFGTQLLYANFMFFLAHFLQLSANQIGITIALTGVGAILGSLIAPTIGRYSLPGRLIVTCCMLEGLATLALLFARNAYVVALVWGIASMFASITIVTYFTLRQKVVPTTYLGRTVAITRLVSYSAIPIASVFGGWLLQATNNMELIISLAGGIMVLNGLIGYFSPLASRVLANNSMEQVNT